MSAMSRRRRRSLMAGRLMPAATLAVLSIGIFIYVRRERLRSAGRHGPNISALIENEARRFVFAWSSPQEWCAAAAVMGECVEQGLRRWWADPQTHILGGDRALARGDGAAAAACFRRALDRQGDNIDALKGSAVALSVCRRHAEAAETYETLLALDPNDVTTRFNLAVALTRLRRFGRAERTYLQLLETDPGNPRAHYNLAALYQMQGKLTLAADTYRSLIASEPTFAPVWLRLGELSLELHRLTGREELLTQAIDAWRRSLELDPSQDRLRDLLKTYAVAEGKTD